MANQLVWFKRDLRTADHAPLVEAARRGPCLCLYVYEPEVFQADDFDPSHLVFINQCLGELDADLRKLGGRLVTRVGAMPDVLGELHAEHTFQAVWAHEETGNDVSYQRDRRVRAWGRQQGVRVIELPQNGVVRRLKTRDGWARRWKQRMQAPILRPPERIQSVGGAPSRGVLPPEALGLPASGKPGVQPGGGGHARATLKSFLTTRGVNYRGDMSSPVAGWEGCSRLSPHLAFGSISLRHVYRATQNRLAEVKRLTARGEAIDPAWAKSLQSFESRLSWHCHFMQKLEDEPRIERENMNRAYDGLRPEELDKTDEEHFAAWRAGRTGYPMVDAVMRCLHATGWVNFRMRAMLVSFAAHHLWLHWRRPAVYLATQFLDYEPGIHYSQFQMQAGTTGISTTRIYSPPKQALDQDPRGEFIRRWVPELARLEPEHLPEPHRAPPLLLADAGVKIGRDYPAPIVDHRKAYAAARDRLFAWKRRAEVRAASQRVYQKHGSRKRPMRRGR